MEKEDLLQREIEEVLIAIDFIKQYEHVESRFTSSDEKFLYASGEILKIAFHAGISLTESPGNQFFAEFEKVNGFKFRIGLTIKYNFIEFDITIKNDEKSISSGGSYGLLVQLMTNLKKNVNNPGFENSTQLAELLTEAFAIYTRIKKAVLQKYTN